MRKASTEQGPGQAFSSSTQVAHNQISHPAHNGFNEGRVLAKEPGPRLFLEPLAQILPDLNLVCFLVYEPLAYS